jgi:aminoglycoside 3-N-acetyltransferase I
MNEPFKIVRLKMPEVDLFQELVQLLNAVFEEGNTVASKNQLKKLLSKSNFHAVAAIKGNKIVGGLTAYELERYYTDKSELYIYDIAIQAELQKQGIGKALINHLKEYATQNEIEAIFVQAYSEDKQAVKFYESTIGKGEKVNDFTIEIKAT